MHCFLICLSLYAVMAAEDSDLNRDTLSPLVSRKCVAPINEDIIVTHCRAKRLRYYYKEDSRLCWPFTWDGCLTDGVHETRLHCTLACNAEHDMLACGTNPINVCPEDHTDTPIDRYYYDKNSRSCKEYSMCGNAGKDWQANSFPSLTACLMHCRGFPINEAVIKAFKEGNVIP
uniref:BPTI/Kunitz inhibitor domain-containing protein n=1 Tax=Amblyomma triste TaxID=251400 RepID=A0A023GA28_AMBTT